MMMKVNEMKNNVKIEFDSAKNVFVGYVNGKQVKRSKHRIHVENKIAMLGVPRETFDEQAKVAAARDAKFGINTRFSFVEKLVTMVAAGVQPSAVITGEGGLGKTFTVVKTLESAGFKDISDLADFQVGDLIRKSK